MPPRSPCRALMSLGLAGAACLALVACMGPDEALVASKPELRHPIGVQAGRASLDVELPPGTEGFSVNQHSDLVAFLATYQRDNTGPLRISVPMAPGEQARARIATEQLRSLLHEADVPWHAVRVERHATHAGERSAVRLTYARRQVVPPECGDWSEDLGRNPERVHYPNFGCATQRNLALNIANPRDLQRPQAEQPSSSERRSVNWTKYVGSLPTSPPTESTSKAAKKPPAAPTAGN